VGRLAKNHILGSSEEAGNYFATSIKRSLGKDQTVSIFGTKYHAWQVAAEVFRHLKADARDNHGIDLERAVVTIPIDFDGRARRELRQAADHAGLYLQTMVHEPFAAVVGYLCGGASAARWAEREGQTILVFDWGGGTLDITAGRIQGGTISELATGGIPDRSGDHFDQLLARFTQTAFMNRHRVNAAEFALQPSTKDRLRAECELRTIDLSTDEEVTIRLRRFYRVRGTDLDLEEPVTRRLFEGLIEADVTQAMAKVDQVLSEAGLRPSDVDLALLIGARRGFRRCSRRCTTASAPN
jgi:molecular chaperone DnaK (HSP70)